MKNKHKRTQHGWGLVETMLTLGALSALSLGIYMVLAPASAAAQAKVEQDNLRDLSTAVDRSFGLLGSFQGVSASRVVEDNLAPTRMVEDDRLRTAWGTSVTIAPHSLNGLGDGFVVVYPFAPADVCPRLAGAVSRDVFDIRIEGASVFDNGQLNVAATAAACGQADAATMEFVYHSGLVAGTAVAAPSLVLPPSNPTVSRPASPPLGAPVGPVAPVGPASPVGPVSTAPPLSPPPVVLPPTAPPTSVTTTTLPTVTLPPVSPPTTVTACVVPPNTIENQNVDCAAGSYGVISQTRFATWSCPEAWDVPLQGAFSGWTVSSSTCQACPSPSTQSGTQWVFTPSTCAAAQYGTRNWEREQARSRSVSYNCPSGTPLLPAPTYGAWSVWMDTGATRSQVNTCSNCPAPTSHSEAQWAATSAVCAAGQWGSTSWEREQTRNRTVSYNCPVGTTSLPAPTLGPWSAWGDTGATRNASGSCVSCPAPVGQTDVQWVPASASCPSGQAGTLTWEAEQTRQRVGSYDCPAGTSALPAPTFSSWSGWANTGATRNVVNTCAPSMVVPTLGEIWMNWGDSAAMTGWFIYCGEPPMFPGDIKDPICTYPESTNDGSTWENPPPRQTPTPEYRACVTAMRATGMDGFPANGVGVPSACSCSVLGSGARLYYSTTGASDWWGFEWKCP